MDWRPAAFFLLSLCAHGAAIRKPGPSAQAAKRRPAPVPAVYVIVNRINPLDEITLVQARDIVRKRARTWPHQVPVILVLSEPGTPAFDIVARSIARVAPLELQQTVSRRDPQVRISPSPEQIIETVSRYGGAIGFLAGEPGSGLLNGAPVKLLRISGF